MRMTSFAASLLLTTALQAQFPIGQPTPVNGWGAELFAEPLWLGNVGFGYRIEGAPPGGSAAIGVTIGRQDQMIGGLQVYLDLTTIVIIHSAPVDAAGRAIVSIPLGSPDDPALTGLQFYAQAAVDDPAAPGVLGTTEAVLLEVTLHPMLAFTTWLGTLWLVDPVYGVSHPVAGLPPTATIHSMAFANAGRDLFVATSAGVYLVDTLAPGPQAVGLTSGPWTSVAWDRVHRRTYTVSSSQGIAVIDGDRSSPAFATVIAQTPGANDTSLALSAEGTLLALTSPTGFVSRRDASPSSPTYLQTIPTPPIPLPVAGLVTRPIQVSPDGRVISVQMQQPFPASLHRFDTLTAVWMDDDPGVAGYQPLQGAVFPSLSNSPTSFFPSRDGSSLVMASFPLVVRFDLDLDSPASLSSMTTPVAPVSAAVSTYVGLTPSGRFLLRRDTYFSSQVVLTLSGIDAPSVTTLATLSGPNGSQTSSVTAWR